MKKRSAISAKLRNNSIRKNKKVQLMTFAQIGLQERNPGGIGNCTLLVNGFNEHGYDEKIVEPLKTFMERIGYQGFAEFDEVLISIPEKSVTTWK